MGNFIQSTLGKDEQVIIYGRVSALSLIPSIFLGVILIPFFGIGIIILIAAFLTHISTELAVTNKRIVAKTGFIRRCSIELNIQKVESIQVHQGVFGRIFNYGSLIISGAGNPQAPITKIDNPMDFRRQATEAIEEYTK